MTKLPEPFISLCPFSIVLFDASSTVSLVNKNFCQLIGLDKQYLIGLSQQRLDDIIASKTPYRKAWYACDTEDDCLGECQSRDIVFEHLTEQLFQQIRVVVEEQYDAGFLYLFKPVIEDDGEEVTALNISHAKHEILSTLTGVYGLSELLIHRDYDTFSRQRKLELIHQQSELLLLKMNNLFDLLEHSQSS